MKTIKKTLGVIGAGSMGMAIALNLKQKGFDVVIRDIRPEIENKAREYGMDVANSSAELASKTDFIIIVVVNATQVHHVLFGSDGVTSHDTRNKTIMLCPTIAVEDTEIFSHQLIDAGFSVMDAPISGGPVRARDCAQGRAWRGVDAGPLGCGWPQGLKPAPSHDQRPPPGGLFDSGTVTLVSPFSAFGRALRRLGARMTAPLFLLRAAARKPPIQAPA